jgi:hypothetical protein
MDGETIGQIKYQATWIYNKHNFLQELLLSMQNERDDLVEEIKQQDKKLQLIAKPFGGYRNIVAIDDIFFEDAYIPAGVKHFLKVGAFEEKLNVKFNNVTGRMGLRNTQWGKATIYMFGMWTIGTSFVCFEKPDFLNVSKTMITNFK